MGMFDWLNSNDNKANNIQIMRKEQALEATTCCIMMADADRNIIYANQAVKDLLKAAEPKLREALPHFSADNLIGQNIDQFHRNPNHQRNILANLKSTMTSSIKVGDIFFKLTLNPLFDENQQNIGTMVEWVDQTELLVKGGMIDALHRSQALTEYSMEGEILDVNENFTEMTGYSRKDVIGEHHSVLIDPAMARSAEYKATWDKLQKGELTSGEFRVIGKGGRELWIQTSFNPILDESGTPTRVVEFATDVTEEKLKNAYFEGQLDAISKSQAVIEFDLEGHIITANENFLKTMGYTLDEVKGKHHSIFVEPEYKHSAEYRNFWEQLNQGTYSSGEYKRLAKNGDAVYIQASYNPVMDHSGKPFRVVKYASDVTPRTTAVHDIKQVMTQLSQGDLTCRLDREFEGEFKILGEAINRFIDDMRETIGQINTAVETINSASSEIASGNADLSSRTEQQASSLEETASSMEELTGTVRLNAENAEQANSLASQASTVAVDGGKVIEQVVKTMSSINESAQKISDIIGVIDGIAFQTNILALNAAVEAARAGEQGRGFAVVASEVRTLAQRSAEAAKDIKELISDSVSKIASGNTLVNQSGDTMQEVVVSIKRVNDIMSEIAAASAEQASGIDEVGKAVTQMDEMTQQNAALVEEAAAAAESLQQQAEQLADRVATFRLSESSGNEKRLAQPQQTRPTVNANSAPANRNAQPAKLKAAKPVEDEWESF